MSESYEKKISNKDSNEEVAYLDYSVMKYLWLANPLSGAKKDSVPKFLRNIEMFKNISDNELRILSRSFHIRKFLPKEVIFRQGDVGVGFYFIYSGRVELTYAEQSNQPTDRSLISLDEFDYFGEVALIQDNSVRTVTATAKDDCVLLGIFKPDLDKLIHNKPVVAAKFLRALSSSFADKLIFLTSEASKQHKRILKLEAKIEEKNIEISELKG